MVTLTVVLIRDGETTNDVRYSRMNAHEIQEELKEETVNDELKIYIQDQVGDEKGREEGRNTLSSRVDPELTPNGYWSAQTCLTDLMRHLSEDCTPPAVDDDGDDTNNGSSGSLGGRKLAYMSAPNRSCTATAIMVTCSDISRYENLNWRLTTYDGACAPASIPCIVVDGLCNGDPHVRRMAGYQCAVEGGLLHCAAQPFNDGRNKCPLMKVVKKMKDVTQETIDEWDEALDENGKRMHQVNYIQYMRFENDDDPWSLKEMTPKVNIVVDFPEPKRYMLPPRKGWFDPKEHYEEWKDENGAELYLRKAVFNARQAGCDTVIMIVPGSAMQNLAKVAGYSSDLDTPPCCAAAVLAEVNGTTPDSIEWSWHSFVNDASNLNIPPFPGPIDEVLHPHEGKDPADAPANKWAAFPDPEPEVIPYDYPKLPPFSECLTAPLPDIPRKKPTHGKPPNAKSSSKGAKPATGKSSAKTDKAAPKAKGKTTKKK